jgi:AcrR family transcriptional regulator
VSSDTSAAPSDAPTRARRARGPKTKWGDREGRRRDILDAARAQMANGGYLALNMRDIAAGAGVSPGTLYQYFSTKEEIFATLYAEAIEAHNERIAPMCAEAGDLESLLRDLATAGLDLFATYGRYFTMWSALQAESDAHDSPLPPELSRALRDATRAQGDLVLTAMRRVAPPEPGEPARLLDDPRALTFVWHAFNGLGDHVTSDRRHLTPFSTDELVDFAARAVAAGLVAPA